MDFILEVNPAWKYSTRTQKLHLAKKYATNKKSTIFNYLIKMTNSKKLGQNCGFFLSKNFPSPTSCVPVTKSLKWYKSWGRSAISPMFGFRHEIGAKQALGAFHRLIYSSQNLATLSDDHYPQLPSYRTTALYFCLLMITFRANSQSCLGEAKVYKCHPTCFLHKLQCIDWVAQYDRMKYPLLYRYTIDCSKDIRLKTKLRHKITIIFIK